MYALTGEWTGKVQTYQGSLPLKFSIAASGDVHARLGSQLETVLNNASVSVIDEIPAHDRRERAIQSLGGAAEEATRQQRTERQFMRNWRLHSELRP
jgi:hypothetical protein